FLTALRRGIRRMEWLFDPLQIKNAYFNMEVLGAVVRRFAPNHYGVDSLVDGGGLPTDVCIAEWEMDSQPVAAILKAAPRPRPPVEATIEVPVEISDIKRCDTRLACEIQQRVSEQFLLHFSRGLMATGFKRTPTVGVFLLSRSDRPNQLNSSRTSR
ncbi:MAG: GNAT family N-acetyltransferase, partial [Bryobacteraceae bacterium]